MKVYLPKNLEAMADNALVQAAIAACYVLQPQFALADEDHPEQEWDTKQAAYCSGITWAFRAEDRKLPPYRDTSGAMGHGYYWVCHHALEWQLKKGTWWAKGTPWHPTKGLTGKAWSQDLDATIRRVNSLLSRAAHKLSCTDNWATWFRSKESFLGREIRKALPHTGTNLLSGQEVNYIDSRFNRGIEEYKRLLKDLEHPDMSLLGSLQNRIKDVGRDLQPLSVTVDRMVSHRIVHVYPKEKRARRAALKKPLKESISELGKREYIFAFDPSILGDKRPFTVDISAEVDDEDVDWAEVRTHYESRVIGFRKQGLTDLATLCSLWADEHISPLGNAER